MKKAILAIVLIAVVIGTIFIYRHFCPPKIRFEMWDGLTATLVVSHMGKKITLTPTQSVVVRGGWSIQLTGITQQTAVVSFYNPAGEFHSEISVQDLMY